MVKSFELVTEISWIYTFTQILLKAGVYSEKKSYIYGVQSYYKLNARAVYDVTFSSSLISDYCIICNNYYKNRQVNTWRFGTNFSHSLHWLYSLLRFVNNVFLKNLYLQPKFCTITWEKTQPLHDAVVYLYFLISDLNLNYSTIIAGIYHFFNNQTVCASFIKGGCLFWKKIWYLWIPKLQKTKCESSLWCYFFFLSIDF